MQGTVKWFKNDKGYGFIAGEDGNDYFVHYGDILMEGHRTLAGGQSVRFEAGNGPKGLKATAVMPGEG